MYIPTEALSQLLSFASQQKSFDIQLCLPLKFNICPYLVCVCNSCSDTDCSHYADLTILLLS